MHVLQGETVLITTEEEGRQLLQHGAVDPATFPSPPRDAAAKKLAEALRKPVDVELTETPVRDVVDYLKDLCHVEIQIDDRRWMRRAFRREAECTIHLKSVSLDAALKQTLDKVGLKHVIQDKVILITAAPPANPRPAKPPADAPEPAGVQPPLEERDAVDRLESLCASYSLNDQGRVTSIWLDSVQDGE